MRINQPGPTNCTFTAPGYGEYKLAVETLGYGMKVTSSEGTARTARTFYPHVRTAGLWYIEAAFTDVESRNAFNHWMLWYVIRTHNPYERPLAPITVIIPPVDFMKMGYPDATVLAFGDTRGKAKYTSVINFVECTDALTVDTRASRYRVARDPAAQFFHPAGTQDADFVLPPPVGWDPPSAAGGRRPLAQ